MSNDFDNAQQIFSELERRVSDGTLAITAGGGVIRGMSTALAKQITNQNGIHIAFNEPTADEDVNPNIRSSGNRLIGVYKLLLDAVREKEAEAQSKHIDLHNTPIHLFLKLQPYHFTAEERDHFFALSQHRNVFSFREPARTLESIIVAMLKITRDMNPDMKVADLVVPGTDLSFIKENDSQKPLVQFVDHVIAKRDFSTLGNKFVSYFSYYPVLNDPILKLDAWQHAYEKQKESYDREAHAAGASNFPDLAQRYQMTPAAQFSQLPDILLAPLRFRRTGYTSMAELHPFLEQRQGQYIVVESTALQLESKAALPQLFRELDLPPRANNPAVSYSIFDAGFLGRPDIRESLFDRVSGTKNIELPEPKLPLTPAQFPAMFLPELAQEYAIYMQYLQDSHRLKVATPLRELFSTRLRDGKPASDYHFTTMYALAAVNTSDKETAELCSAIRRQHTQYAQYFGWIDQATTSRTATHALLPNRPATLGHDHTSPQAPK